RDLPAEDDVGQKLRRAVRTIAPNRQHRYILELVPLGLLNLRANPQNAWCWRVVQYHSHDRNVLIGHTSHDNAVECAIDLGKRLRRVEGDLDRVPLVAGGHDM